MDIDPRDIDGQWENIFENQLIVQDSNLFQTLLGQDKLLNLKSDPNSFLGSSEINIECLKPIEEPPPVDLVAWGEEIVWAEVKAEPSE